MGANLRLVHRRPIDRLRSLFQPVQRFRCPVDNCHWEGNIPALRGVVARDRARLRWLAIITVCVAVGLGYAAAHRGVPDRPATGKKK